MSKNLRRKRHVDFRGTSAVRSIEAPPRRSVLDLRERSGVGSSADRRRSADEIDTERLLENGAEMEKGIVTGDRRSW